MPRRGRIEITLHPDGRVTRPSRGAGSLEITLTRHRAFRGGYRVCVTTAPTPLGPWEDGGLRDLGAYYLSLLHIIVSHLDDRVAAGWHEKRITRLPSHELRSCLDALT